MTWHVVYFENRQFYIENNWKQIEHAMEQKTSDNIFLLRVSSVYQSGGTRTLKQPISDMKTLL